MLKYYVDIGYTNVSTFEFVEGDDAMRFADSAAESAVYSERVIIRIERESINKEEEQ